ncbi:arginine--tRNA ligase domain-containing protein, partial [Lactobacillus crispatus]|uniref:arginine--tRNA ligase domain-containing protein n=1 Tax=Lactobacillus crispatus TaxID=47770 RepID=UPI0027FEA1EC
GENPAIIVKSDGTSIYLTRDLAAAEWRMKEYNFVKMLQNMKSRGLKQVELFLSDGVVGMKTALARTYPKAHFQRCLVHVMRNICAKVRVDDR